jgi:[acyl-carrier-protein] S-malonyltransferase
MEPIMGEFREVISSFVFHPPKIPIIANITAEPMVKVESIKEELLKQLRHCIRWQHSIEYMTLNGVTTFYEIGPGKVLSGLIKRISAQAQTINISGIGDIAQLEKLAISNQL